MLAFAHQTPIANYSNFQRISLWASKQTLVLLGPAPTPALSLLSRVLLRLLLRPLGLKLLPRLSLLYLAPPFLATPTALPLLRLLLLPADLDLERGEIERRGERLRDLV